MPFLFDSSEWLLLCELGQAFGPVRSPFCHNRPQAKHHPVAEHIESGLRLLLRPKVKSMYSSQELSDDKFNTFQSNLCKLCTVLNNIVSEKLSLPLIPQAAVPYPRLRLLRQFLASADTGLDLVHGQTIQLFTLPGDDGELYRYRRLVDDANEFLDSLNPPLRPESETSMPSRSETRDAWEKARVRKQATRTLDALFQRFTCDAEHEVLLRLTQDTGEKVSLQLMLPTTCREIGSWLQARCQALDADALSPPIINDICGNLRSSLGHGKMLALYVKNSQLRGDWKDSTLPVTQSCRESLRDLIDRGDFKKLSTDINAALHNPQVKSFSTIERRRLAVELGFGLMDFFDAEVSSKRVYILHNAEQDIQPHLAFKSKLPTISNPYKFSRFRPHPMLLSFAKLLLEICYGQILHFEIGAGDGQDLESWVRLGTLVESLRNTEPDPCLEAIESCLVAHLEIARALDNAENLSVKDAERKIRRKLYEEVVHKLEQSVAWWSSLSSRSMAKLSSSSQRKRKHLESSLSSPNDSDSSRSKSHGASSAFFESDTGPRQRKKSRGRGSSDTPTHGPLRPEDFEIAIICALGVEYDAISLLVDGYWDQLDDSFYGKADGDTNMYRTCHIGKANVVLVRLPAMGKVSAAMAATSLSMSFRGLKLVLVVGICGGVPFPGKGEEMLLGDVAVSNSAIQYDLGRRFPDTFAAKEGPRDSLRKLPRSADNLVTFLQSAEIREDAEAEAAEILHQLQAKGIGFSQWQWQYPGARSDRLFQSDFHHKHHRYLPSMENRCRCYTSSDACSISRSLSCREAGCLNNDELIEKRERLEKKRAMEINRYPNDAQAPFIFVGPFGSADTVLKSAEDRDRYAKDHGLVAFEMEGAGVWDIVPSIVVKGVCDYADSHKNKDWQAFASLTAASVAKVILNLYMRDSGATQRQWPMERRPAAASR